ncbi:hypothetical protein EXM90_00640 [Clostridium botulinum]|uniref:Uncharacterized protein n=1 Tax=Clostridium botulinum TaxID=1491 RepID=A0A6B4FXP4_CLOBO|nr:hypothetical protein [Clostridium botulinum]MBN3381140.1 hypothetical protein [Clostridium botulinum]MBN3389707.1 hypothetical protein [Clostridium botulinum]MBN3430253.1 hypothetical protein [Clostridium botulinum]NFB62688.1 hypothetical protein [Clostridium botulinum]
MKVDSSSGIASPSSITSLFSIALDSKVDSSSGIASALSITSLFSIALDSKVDSSSGIASASSIISLFSIAFAFLFTRLTKFLKNISTISFLSMKISELYYYYILTKFKCYNIYSTPAKK